MPASPSPPSAETTPKPAVVPVRMPAAVARKVPSAEPTKLYECGTLEGCPRQQIDLTGVSFTAFRGTPTIHTDGRVTGATGRGNLIRLTDSQKDAVLAKVAARIVRIRASGAGDVYDTTAPNFRAQSGDRPLSDYLFMREITDAGVAAAAAAPEPLTSPKE